MDELASARASDPVAVSWVEASLAVDGELAEAVAEVMSRYVGNAVAMEQGARHDDVNELGSPDGLITVRAYFPMNSHWKQTRQQIEEGIGHLRMIHDLPALNYRTLGDQNWMEAWRKHYRPIRVGRRLLVLPAWMESPEPNRLAIKIEPGMAFGTGTHPSTQLCLELIDRLMQPAPRHEMYGSRPRPTTFIDVGCGSGILSLAALKLGAHRALGVDVELDAIQSARENARLNGIGAELQLEVASMSQILEGRFSLRTASLVAVNILAPVIVGMLRGNLADLVQPGGWLVMAGILESQAPEVQAAAIDAGLAAAETLQIGEWVAFSMFTRHQSDIR